MPPDLLTLLDLEQIDLDLYRTTTVFEEEFALYGGQVAAQALRAAGSTVAPDRLPHSLHCYFLRPGDPSRPTVFRVSRDRDGGSFSARRVVAVQQGDVILNLVCSFHRRFDGPAEQAVTMPATSDPETLPELVLPRVFSFEARSPEQPYDRALWPTRFWARTTAELGADPLVRACALVYLSDISTGVLPSADGSVRPQASIDHSLWLHNPSDLTQWTLFDYHPVVSGAGRASYRGTAYRDDGLAVATIAQETLFR